MYYSLPNLCQSLAALLAYRVKRNELCFSAHFWDHLCGLQTCAAFTCFTYKRSPMYEKRAINSYLCMIMLVCNTNQRRPSCEHLLPRRVQLCRLGLQSPMIYRRWITRKEDGAFKLCNTKGIGIDLGLVYQARTLLELLSLDHR